MKHGVLIGMISLLALTGAFAEDEEAKKKAALKAAGDWLALVDQEDYAKSWGTAAGFFKKMVSEKDWAKAGRSARKPLGPLKSRKLLSQKIANSLPGAPDGEYVVIQYTSSFKYKKSAVETVTPMKDPDGTWRVSGYYIR